MMNCLLILLAVYVMGLWVGLTAVREIVLRGPPTPHRRAMVHLGIVAALFWPFAVLWYLFAALHVIVVWSLSASRPRVWRRGR